MSSKIAQEHKTKWYSFFIFIVLIIFSTNSNAQCAGEDAVITICNIPDVANQTINLFSLLNGTPTAGGVWTDPLQSGGLDTATGILNVWNIHISGTYSFIYTVNNIAACTDNTATITVTIGGYSGITSPNGSACSDNDSVNLFQFFVGDPPNPHLNGVWTDNNNTGALSGNFFNATAVALGTYSFTYTMPAVGTCAQTSSTAIITVHRAPEPGTAQDLVLCETDEMSGYTNLNLFTFLSGHDLNGRWSEAGTSELSSPFDSFINVENIFNTHGPGTYSFTYTVYPTNPVCSIKTASINIIIERILDLTGATLVINSDICENELEGNVFTGILTQGAQNIPNGVYEIELQISGQTSTHNFVSQFTGGVFTFELDSDLFSGPGTYTLTIIDIFDAVSLQACDNIVNVSDVFNIFPTPSLEGASLDATPVCLGSGAEIQLSEATGLEDGNYSIVYNLSGSNTAQNQTTILVVDNGSTSLSVPASLLSNAGTTSITIISITNLQTLCTSSANLSTSFPVNASPNTSNLSIIINDICENEQAIVSLSGFANMTDITLNYTLSGVNPATNETVSLTITAGNGNFIIPSALLSNTGTSTLTINSLIDNTTTCSATINLSDIFTINSVPDAPVADNAIFCEEENATVADLLPNGANYNWYDSANATQALTDSIQLTSGNYYVSQKSETTDCVSDRTMITVTINSIPAPTLQQDGERFCGADNPTLQDLTENTNASETVIWYDALTNGNELSNTQLLEEGFTYYGYQFSNTLNCTSVNALAVMVTLTDCDDDEDYGFFIPDGFSPNGDGVNETFRIPDIEFLYPNFTLEIYNRYGNLMFSGNKNKPNWNGKNSDSNTIDGMAPNGVYFYVIHLNKNNISPKQGRLYLNR